MKIGVLKELSAGETRVSAVPEDISKYVQNMFDVLVEQNAGQKAGFDDEAYLKAGAVIATQRKEIFQNADMILAIHAPSEQEYPLFEKKQIIIADFESLKFPERIKMLAKTGVTALALERMPRISRAQNMDILSSQNNLAGYKAAISAACALNRATALMITSAGTIAPAKALVIGAGIAGLQAIATLKRLGAVVFATDVRAAAKEQVESLGAHYLQIEQTENFEDGKGYAKQTSEEFQKKQHEAILQQLSKTDILITTAMSATKNIPLLVSADDLSHMPSNAVIVDMAGGNVEQNPKRTDLIFIQNNLLAAEIPYSASRLFSKNIYNLIETYGGQDFKLNLQDEILKAICLCHNGKINTTES